MVSHINVNIALWQREVTDRGEKFERRGTCNFYTNINKTLTFSTILCLQFFKVCVYNHYLDNVIVYFFFVFNIL